MLDSDDEEGESEGEEAEGEGVDALLVAAPAAYGRTLGTLTLSRDAVHWGELGAERPSLSFPVSDVAKAAIQPKAPASPWVPATTLIVLSLRSGESQSFDLRCKSGDALVTGTNLVQLINTTQPPPPPPPPPPSPPPPILPPPMPPPIQQLHFIQVLLPPPLHRVGPHGSTVLWRRAARCSSSCERSTE